MDLIKTRGIILKSQEYREKDRLLVIFTLEQGKVTVLAKGVRSVKGRFHAAGQPMTLGDFVLFPGKNIHQLNEASAVHSFPGARTDVIRLTYATYFLELADIAMADREVNEKFFLDLVKSLYLLEQPHIQPEHLARAFEMKTLVHTGNLPDPQLGKGMSESARQAIRVLLNKPIEEALEETLSPQDLAAAGEITDLMLKENFQRRPKSLDILKQME